MEFHAKRKTFKSILEEEEEEEEEESEEESESARHSVSGLASPWTLSPLHRISTSTSPSILYHCLATLHRQDGNAVSIAVSKGLIFAASESDRVHVWKQPDCVSRGYIRTRHHKISTMLAYNNTLFTAHSDNRIRAWSIFNTRKLATLPPNNKSLFSRKTTQSRRHHNTITCLALYHAEALLYSGSVDRMVKVWRLNDPTRSCVDSFTAHDGVVNAMLVNQKDGCLFTGSMDWSIKIWRRAYGDYTHALVLVLRFQSSPVNALALSSLSSHLYSGSTDGHINIWEKEEKFVSTRYRHRGFLHMHRRLQAGVLCLVTVGRTTLISGSEDATIRVWRRNEYCGTHVCMAVMEGHQGPVKCLATSMEVQGKEEVEEEDLGFLLYSAGFDRMLKVWRVKVVGKERGGGEEGMSRLGGCEMSPVLSPLWVEKRIQGMHLYSSGGTSN